MKHLKSKILIGLIAISINSYGQNNGHKNSISIGGGRESYNGDLGNSWFKPKEEFYAFVTLSYSRYLSKSFDITASVSHGDYGRCRDSDEDAIRADGTEVLNMLSRLTTGVLSIKYKLANGYILREDSKLAPYIYLGGGINNLSNYWWENKNRVNTGNYGSINGGIGLRYNFYKNINLSYDLGFGYFTSDNIDKRIEGKNDMYMQHSLLLGINF